MKWLKILCIVSVVTLLQSCSTLTTRSTEPTKRSANSLIKCPPITKMALDTFGDSNLVIETLINMYVDCAVRHNGDVGYEEKIHGD